MAQTFLGLQPYAERDAYRFKGRSEESAELFRLVTHNDFTVCYAESGEGKTSLLNAGVFPLLRQNMYFPIAITFTSDDYQATPNSFDRIINRCINDSISEYNEQNLGINIEYRLCTTDFADLDCQERLQTELSDYSWWKLRNYKPQAMGLVFTPVFVFDQFEEVFSMPGSIVWTKTFFDWLEEVSFDSCPDYILYKVRSIIGADTTFPTIKEEKDFKAIFSLRKEFIGELDYWGMQTHFIPALKDNRYCLKALTYDGARKVMNLQARFEANKVEQVLTYFVGQYSREPERTIKENLPVIPALLLSVVCDSWDEDIDSFTTLDVNEIGQSLSKILERFYNQAIDKIASDISDQLGNISSEACRYDLDTAVFALIDGNGKRVRTKTTISELIQIEFIGRYMEALRHSRIIKVSRIEGEDYVEIVHDSLCSVIAKRKGERMSKEAAKKEDEEKQHVEEENRKIKLQNDRLNRIRSLFLAEKANSCLRDRYLAQKLALEALPIDIEHPDKPFVPQAETTLRQTMHIPYCPMIGQGEVVTQVLCSSDGKKLFSLSRNGKIRVWDAFSGVLLNELGNEDNTILTIAKCGEECVSIASWKGEIQIQSMDSLTISDRISIGEDVPNVSAICQNCSSIAIEINDGKLLLYTQGEIPMYEQTTIKKIENLLFSPSGDELVALGEGKLACYSMVNQKWNSIEEDNYYAITCACYSQNGHFLFCGTENGEILVLEKNEYGRKTRKVIDCESGHSKISSISVSSNTREIVYSYGNKLKIILNQQDFQYNEADVDAPIPQNNILNYPFEPIITCVSWSPNDRYIIWGNVDGEVLMYDTQPGPQNRKLIKAKSSMSAIEYSPEGDRIFCLSTHDTFRIIDTKSGDILHRENHMHRHSAGKEEYRSMDGQYRLVFNKSKQEIELYDDFQQSKKYSFGVYGELTSVSFSSDSSLVAVATNQGAVICKETATGVDAYVLEGCKSMCNRMLFSPTGRKIAIIAPNRDVILMNERTGLVEDVIPVEKGYVFSLAFSPDGGRLAIGTDFGEIRIWNVVTKEQVDVLRVDDYGLSVRCVAFSPDGERLSASYSDGCLVEWDCPSLKTLINDIRGKLDLRGFTDNEKRAYYLE